MLDEELQRMALSLHLLSSPPTGKNNFFYQQSCEMEKHLQQKQQSKMKQA